MLIFWSVLPLFGHADLFFNPAELAAHLNTLPKIRVLSKDAGGNGHQAANVTLIKKLREIGYQGKIELLYEPSTKQRMEFLLPPFRADGPGCQTIRELDVDVCPFNERKSPDEYVRLAISAAADGLSQAAQLNVDYHVIVHPPNWGISRLAQRGVVENMYIADARSEFPFQRVVNPVKDPVAFIRAQMQHSQNLRAKVPGLEALFHTLAKGDTELLTAYGLSFEGEKPLASILQALEVARAKSPQSFLPKTAIALTSKLNVREWRQVFTHLKQLNFDSRKLHLIDSKDADAGQKLAAVAAGEIAILQIGAVTQDVWNYLIESSTLPPTVAGANGLDYASQLGKPFAITNEAAIYKMYDMPEDLQEFLVVLQKEMSAGEVDALADFFVDSKNPQSKTFKMFHEYSQHQCALPDRTCTALLASKHIWMPGIPMSAFCKGRDVRESAK